MKKLIMLLSVVVLAACSGGPEVDASSQQAFESSVKEITQSLDKEQRPDFQRAVIYFTMGGKGGMAKLMAQAAQGDSDGADKAVMKNLQAIDGLTAEEVIEKYNEEKGK